MFINATKRIISSGLSFTLVLVLAIGIIPSEKVHAASFSNINNSTMFFKQNTSSTCTLASAAMMVRRAALLSGNSNWTAVTENNLKSTAWLSGTGLYNSFSYAGINVSSTTISSNRTQTMINLLSQHPEGIVIYDYGKPHAILLTDYTNGTFYCADPSSAAPSGRIPISQATITVESIDKYWYVSSPQLSLTAEDTTPPTISNIRLQDINRDGYTVICNVSDNTGVTSVRFPSWNADTHSGTDADWLTGSLSGNTATCRVNIADLKSGAVEGYYMTHIYAYDAAGNVSFQVIPVHYAQYIDRTPPEITEVQVKDITPDGYTVTCKAVDRNGIDRVQFPTWTVAGGQDDIAASWQTNSAVRGTEIAEGKYEFTVNTSEHGKEAGIYRTHIYAYDTYGNSICYEISDVSVPGADFGENYHEIHDFDNPTARKVTKAATCTQTGTEERTCRCGEKKEFEIPMKEHTPVKDAAVAATCTKTGLTEGSRCSVCSTVLKAQKTIPAKGHSYSTKYTVDKKATFTADGSKSYHCKNCTAKKELSRSTP